MEWNEVDLVQEFTVEGQCSKIKVRSCRITWDSLQVNTAQRGKLHINVSWGAKSRARPQDVVQPVNTMSS